jgi:hypothetical protein
MNNKMEVTMKALVIISVTAMLLPGVLFSGPAATDPDDQNCNVYIEDISYETSDQTIHTFLTLDPFATDEDVNNAWSYYVVFSKPAKTQILNAFLPRLQQFHHHSKLSFSAVADYWEEIFQVPVQIFVFCTNGEPREPFCTSPPCERLVTTARILGLGFIWNGALSIAEPEIKEIRGVPEEYKLVTTIFLPEAEIQEVSRVQK